MAHDDDLITAAEAGILFGKTPRTIARMAGDGALPAAHKLPGKTGAYLFRRADVEAWLEAHQQPTRP